MKLVFEYNWVVEHVAEGTNTIPFEYSSVEDFQYMVLEKIRVHKEACIQQYGTKDGNVYYLNGSVEVLGIEMNAGNLENSIDNVLELSDWFDRNKIKQ